VDELSINVVIHSGGKDDDDLTSCQSSSSSSEGSKHEIENEDEN